MKTIITLISIAIAGSAQAADAVKVELPAQKILSTQSGRFVFGQISEFQRDQYLLDTQTGKLWRVVADGGRKNQDGTVIPGSTRDVLQSVLVADRDGNAYEWDSPEAARIGKEPESFVELLKKPRSK